MTSSSSPPIKLYAMRDVMRADEKRRTLREGKQERVEMYAGATIHEQGVRETERGGGEGKNHARKAGRRGNRL